jgi:hypothetical protein
VKYYTTTPFKRTKGTNNHALDFPDIKASNDLYIKRS